MMTILQTLGNHRQYDWFGRRLWVACCARSAPLLALVVAACTRLESAGDLFGAIPTDGGGSGAGSSGTSGAIGLQTGIGAAGSRSSNVGTAGQSNANAACWNSSGQQGLECYRCPPESFLHFERACTDAHCVPFDNSRSLTKVSAEGRLPPLPTAPGGSANATLGASGSEGSYPSTGASELTGTAGNTSIPPASGNAGASASLATGGATSTGDSPAVRCDELPNTSKTVYVTGSSAATPFLQEIARQLAARSTRIVYVAAGSCTGVDAAINRTALRTGPAPAVAASALYWSSSTSTGERCQLPPEGVVVDLGISDVFVQTCPGFELTSLESLRVKDAHGPIQTMAFVVPAGSTYSTISAQAAYFVFGFGKEGGVVDASTGAPIWNDDEYLYVRGPSSGTQAMLASTIGVPSSRWVGKRAASSDEVAQLLHAASVTSGTADKALGILAVDYIDSRDLRGQLRILAFQDTDQVCAFFPDSTATARDKRNVRDGHYPIFGPLHLLYRADATGAPEDSSKREELLDVVGYLSGSKPLPNGARLLDVFAKRGLIPECAMRVTRTKDGGSLVGFSSANPCSCAFERAATGMTKCAECRVQADCKPDESCSMGYCEKLP